MLSQVPRRPISHWWGNGEVFGEAFIGKEPSGYANVHIDILVIGDEQDV